MLSFASIAQFRRHLLALGRVGSQPHTQQEGVVEALVARAEPAEDEEASARDRRVAGA
eukprot:CAMPEP_0179901122 /NCGR_PEP_ID=MMETSP0982-20121206/39565_1 /TAXON_ID=483367 /ORGANISM="non described non described, Strain CCMP 2436" /LENGTH=57 /DNA_ID=CAMNT_0021799587 /DNA_START=19 /DNA_END=189 /DNA_ORIENTATION=-